MRYHSAPRRHRSEPLAAVPFLAAIASGGSDPVPARRRRSPDASSSPVTTATRCGAPQPMEPGQELVRTYVSEDRPQRSTHLGGVSALPCASSTRQQQLAYRDVSDRSRRRTRSALAEVRGDLHAGGWAGWLVFADEPPGRVARDFRCGGCSGPLVYQAEAGAILDSYGRGQLLCLDELVRDPDFRDRSVFYVGHAGPVRNRLNVSRTTRNRASQPTWRK